SYTTLFRSIVFAAQAEFSGNVNSRLVRKRHACFQYGFAAAYKIRMFVAVEPDAVSQAVREKLVVRAIPRAGDDRARRIVNRSGQLTRSRGVQSSVLRFADQIVCTRDFFRRLAKDTRARDVR